MKTETRAVAKINGVQILVIENGEKLVPVKPICEALGVAPNKQIEKIKEDEILKSVGTLGVSTGSDGKQYEMFCIPFKYVFGWLFTINPANVKEEARESVIRYKLACYDALYQSFTDSQEFLEAKDRIVETKLAELEVLSANFKSASASMAKKKRELNDARAMTIDQWLANNRQMEIFAQEADAAPER